MIPNIVRGGRFLGLMLYLQGDGRANDHFDQHVVTGSTHLDLPVGPLNAVGARYLADQLDEPRIAFGTRVEIVNRERVHAAVASGVSRAVALSEATKDAHVWHCSLSLAPEEGVLSDDTWKLIARDFMTEMGFDPVDESVAPARWVAVRHGVGKNGNDHIHIAASVVRDDGTKVDTFKDFDRAQKTARKLEATFGLVQLHSRERQLGERGLKPAELDRTSATGADAEPPRRELERRVRAIAAASRTEAEFVRRLRTDGLRIRPRYAKELTTDVVGYSVALAQRSGTTIWFGGGRLAKDLTLPRLRDEWDQTAETATEAAREWGNASAGRPMASSGRETKQVGRHMMTAAVAEVEKWNAYLASIPLEDHAQWARAAGRSAAMFAAWSTRMAPDNRAFRDAARTLRTAAETQAHTRWRADVHKPAMSGSNVAVILLQAQLDDPTAAWTLLLHQLMKTARAIADAQRAAGDLERALRIESVVASQLTAVHASYPPVTPQTRQELDAEFARVQARVRQKPLPLANENEDQRRARMVELARKTRQLTPQSHDRGLER